MRHMWGIWVSWRRLRQPALLGCNLLWRGSGLGCPGRCRSL